MACQAAEILIQPDTYIISTAWNMAAWSIKTNTGGEEISWNSIVAVVSLHCATSVADQIVVDGSSG